MNPFRNPLALLVLGAAVAALAQTPVARPPVTLEVGDPAPPLRVGRWIKGQAVPSLADGTVHVVEFWATWCGPCKSSMPHLSTLAERYRGRATFIGVNVWESRGPDRVYRDDVEKASRFAGNAGRMMDYTVAMDTEENAMAATWMAAAGQNGIPASFVVDGKGTILWIGHPQVGLEEVVALAVEGKLDVETGKRVKDEARARFNRFYALNKTYAEATKAKDYRAAYAAGDEAATLLPSITDPIEMKISALLHTDRPAARALAEKAAKDHDRAPLFLASVARSLLDEDAPGATREDDALALRLARSASAFNPDDLFTLPVLALAYSKTGDRAKAVEAQARYVALLADPKLKAPAKLVEEAKARLEGFKAASL